MRWNFGMKCICAVAAALSLCGAARGALSQTSVLLPVSDGEIKLGEWNGNFAGARAIADSFNIPLLVFYGGLSCGKCEELQNACLSDEFIAWQNGHRMLMVFTTNNSKGDASGFARPADSTGYPFIAVYWNRDGQVPEKGSDRYKAFNGRDGEMPVKEGSLAGQLIGSIESVVAGYDFSSAPDISANAELLYSNPVTTRLSYDVGLFTGLDAAAALSPQTVYNLRGSAKPKLKKTSGKLPSGVRLVYSDGAVSLKGTAKTPGAYTYAFSIQQRVNGVLYAGPEITISFTVAAANDASMGGCAMLGRALKATVPLFAAGGDAGSPAGTLEFSTTARGRITAKYTSLSRSKASFAGSWATIEGGCAKAVLTTRNKSKSLAVELAGDGRFAAAMQDAAQPAALESPDGLKICTGLDAAAFGGEHAAGSSVIKKISAAGRAMWSAQLANGRKASGKAFAMLDGAGRCIVHLFKATASYAVNEVLRVSPGIQEAETFDGGAQ